VRHFLLEEGRVWPLLFVLINMEMRCERQYPHITLSNRLKRFRPDRYLGPVLPWLRRRLEPSLFMRRYIVNVFSQVLVLNY